MKDWKTVELKALNPHDRARYCTEIQKVARAFHEPIVISTLYQRYKDLPADIAARLIDLAMQKSGWNDPPKSLINEVAAMLYYIRELFLMCQDIPGLIANDYIDESNKDEVYKALLELHHQDDIKRQAEAMAAFAKSTQMGGQ
jgi:hypothetical protein